MNTIDMYEFDDGWILNKRGKYFYIGLKQDSGKTMWVASICFKENDEFILQTQSSSSGFNKEIPGEIIEFCIAHNNDLSGRASS